MRRWLGKLCALARMENIPIIILCLAAMLLAMPALRELKATPAQRGRDALVGQLQRVVSQARRQRCAFTVSLPLGAQRFVVTRWKETTIAGELRPEAVPQFDAQLRYGIVVRRNSVPAHSLVITARGFVLSSGRIDLEASDGSVASLSVGKALSASQ